MSVFLFIRRVISDEGRGIRHDYMASLNEVKDFTDLLVWQKGHMFVKDIYTISQGFPKEEMFGITSQVRRAAVSITCNIAEGYARYYFGDMNRFYYMARGSTAEVMNLLLLAKDFNWVADAKCSELIIQSQEIRQMLSGLIQSVRLSQSSSPND
jgi:four helix bundle protein